MIGHGEDAPAAGRQAAAVKDSGVLQFFVLAYGLAWLWLAVVGLSGSVITAGSGWPTHLPALVAPAVAAILLSLRTDGRRGIGKLAKAMVSPAVALRWWLFAISPLLVVLVVLGAQAAAGLPRTAVADFAIFSGVSDKWGVTGVAVVILIVNGFGEETGWRGFALARLQSRCSPLTATLIVGLLWALWHAPMFLVVRSFREFTIPIACGWAFSLLCGAVVLSWLYNRSGGSILMVAIWHTGYNLTAGTAAATGLLAIVPTALVITGALLLVGLELLSQRVGKPTVIGPRECGTEALARRPD